MTSYETTFKYESSGSTKCVIAYFFVNLGNEYENNVSNKKEKKEMGGSVFQDLSARPWATEQQGPRVIHELRCVLRVQP